MHRKKSRQSVEEPSDNLNIETVKECVHYILCREGSKIPIKRFEIFKHLENICQSSSSQINSIILHSEKMLKQIYGYKLVQIPSKTGVQYIVVLADPCKNALLSTIVDGSQRLLLVTALIHVFMSGGIVKDDDMWGFLAEAGLLEESDFTGRKLLTHQFTKQLYLKYTKINDNELARYIFEWGQRAIEEIPKLFLLNMMAEAFDKQPSDWMEQYKDCLVSD